MLLALLLGIAELWHRRGQPVPTPRPEHHHLHMV
jgi:hypothetical protein